MQREIDDYIIQKLGVDFPRFFNLKNFLILLLDNNKTKLNLKYQRRSILDIFLDISTGIIPVLFFFLRAFFSLIFFLFSNLSSHFATCSFCFQNLLNVLLLNQRTSFTFLVCSLLFFDFENLRLIVCFFHTS